MHDFTQYLTSSFHVLSKLPSLAWSFDTITRISDIPLRHQLYARNEPEGSIRGHEIAKLADRLLGSQKDSYPQKYSVPKDL
jgi:hypothetical protein